MKVIINDPIGQATVPADCDFCFIWKGWDGRTETCAKTVITTGRDFGRPRGSIIKFILLK